MSFSISDLGFTLDQVVPGEGWHCSHFFYRFNRDAVAGLEQEQLAAGCEAFRQALCPSGERQPARLQVGLTSGHKADFSLMMMDPDPIRIESVHQDLLAGHLGKAIETTWSYVSISEVSEYAQTVPQYRQKLIDSGEDESGTAFETKVNTYAQRLEKMNFQRLTPNFPDWPVSCFYPMNKWRLPDANWYQLSSEQRHELMSEHARSGIKFAGKVSQLITVGIGLDDWEWGVTLWATNPMHLKQIVYDMRFDTASARYAEFGPFYTSYRCDAAKILEVCRISKT